MWPVDDPPKPRLHATLQGPSQATVKFDGPLNLLVALHAAQQAAVEVVRTDTAYNELDHD